MSYCENYLTYLDRLQNPNNRKYFAYNIGSCAQSLSGKINVDYFDLRGAKYCYSCANPHKASKIKMIYFPQTEEKTPDKSEKTPDKSEEKSENETHNAIGSVPSTPNIQKQRAVSESVPSTPKKKKNSKRSSRDELPASESVPSTPINSKKKESKSDELTAPESAPSTPVSQKKQRRLFSGTIGFQFWKSRLFSNDSKRMSLQPKCDITSEQDLASLKRKHSSLNMKLTYVQSQQDLPSVTTVQENNALSRSRSSSFVYELDQSGPKDPAQQESDIRSAFLLLEQKKSVRRNLGSMMKEKS